MAAVSVGTATGTRAWIGHQVGERGRRVATIVLLGGAVVASGVVLG